MITVQLRLSLVGERDFVHMGLEVRLPAVPRRGDYVVAGDSEVMPADNATFHLDGTITVRLEDVDVRHDRPRREQIVERLTEAGWQSH